MANAAIQITNLTVNPLSLDAKISEDFSIRALLAPAGDVLGKDVIDVGDGATLGELNKNDQIQRLLSTTPASIRINVAAGDTDVVGSESNLAVAPADNLSGSKLIFDFDVANGLDQPLIAAMPFNAEVIGAEVIVTTVDATETATFHDAAAAGGAALSMAFPLDTAAHLYDDGSAGIEVLSVGDPVYVNLSAGSDTFVGKVILHLNRLS